MATIATLRNMKIHSKDYVFAYSYNTGEGCSADPGDYWHLDEDEPLLDADGGPMVLVFKHSYLQEV